MYDNAIQGTELEEPQQRNSRERTLRTIAMMLKLVTVECGKKLKHGRGCVLHWLECFKRMDSLYDWIYYLCTIMSIR